MSTTKIGIVIHGGAGTILKSQMSEKKEKAYKEALQEARDIGYHVLAEGGTSLRAVEVAVASLENSPLMDAEFPKIPPKYAFSESSTDNKKPSELPKLLFPGSTKYPHSKFKSKSERGIFACSRLLAGA